MATPKTFDTAQELTPAQQEFLTRKQQQRARDAALGKSFRSDRGTYLKTERQKREEEKAARVATQPRAPSITRREFLSYAWGAAMGTVLAEIGVASFIFAMPRFKAGELGGIFELGTADSLPAVGATPIRNLDGAFWLVNDDDGVRALYRVCTHLGCLYEWKEQTFRFECPCHGSKFQHNGTYIEGPAPRSLDQFLMRLEKDGQVLAAISEGSEALPISDPDATVVVDTGAKLLGKPR